MSLRSFLRLGWEGVRRERGTLPALAVFVLLFFLLYLLVIARVSVLATQRIARSAGDVRVDLLDDASPDIRATFAAALRSLPYVEHAVFLSHDQALETARGRDPELAAFLDAFALANPFPDAYSVRLTTFDAYPDFLRFLQQPSWASVVDASVLSAASTQEADVRTVLSAARAAGAFVNALLFIVFLAVVLTVAAFTWRRAVDRQEFALPWILGGRAVHVVLPFAAEHTVLLLIALGIAALLALACGGFLFLLIPLTGGYGALAAFRSTAIGFLPAAFPLATVVFAVLCPGIAVLGAIPALPNIRAVDDAVSRRLS